jgi:FG-GAP-like repeat
LSRRLDRTVRGVGSRRVAAGTALILSVGVVPISALVGVPVSGVARTTQAAPVSRMVAVNEAASAGIRDAHVRTWSAAPGDFNGDGAEDVLINYHGLADGRRIVGAKIWRNRGSGRYRWIARHAFPSENSQGRFIDRHNCDWADVDRNGRTDVYCSAGRTESNIVKHGRDNELWLQGRRGRFREVGTAWHVGDPCGRGRVVTFLRANRDRFPDLFVGNDEPRRVPDVCNRSPRLPSERSKLFLNVGGHGFRRAPRFWNSDRAGQGARCAEVLDFNGDGWQDLFTCGRKGRTPRLYANRRGHRLVDVTPRRNLRWPLTNAVVADLDVDGDPDLVTSARARFGYHLNDNGHFGPLRLIAPVPGPGRGWSVAAGDADGDGDVDVYGMVERGLRRNPDDWIWLNDGMQFTPIRVPHAGGAADDVIALRPRSNGRTAFLVLNGRKRFRSGAVQLIRLVRR